MGVSATSTQNMVIGAGDLFYKDANGVWQPAGATSGDGKFSVTRTYTTAVANGVRGPLLGTDYITKEVASLQVPFMEITSALMALLVPDAASTGGVDPTVVGGGGGGTLAAATTPGQSLAIKLSSVTGLTVGDFIRIGAGSGILEFRTLTRVGTLGSGGTGVDVDFPLTYAHANGANFSEVTGDGSTIITSGPNRRLPTSAYRDFFLLVPGLDGRDTRFVVMKAIATGPADFNASDSAFSMPTLSIEGRIDPALPYVQPWQIVKIPTYLVS